MALFSCSASASLNYLFDTLPPGKHKETAVRDLHPSATYLCLDARFLQLSVEDSWLQLEGRVCGPDTNGNVDIRIKPKELLLVALGRTSWHLQKHLEFGCLRILKNLLQFVRTFKLL